MTTVKKIQDWKELGKRIEGLTKKLRARGIADPLSELTKEEAELEDLLTRFRSLSVQLVGHLLAERGPHQETEQPTGEDLLQLLCEAAEGDLEDARVADPTDEAHTRAVLRGLQPCSFVVTLRGQQFLLDAWKL